MASLVGYQLGVVGRIGDVDATRRNPLGSRSQDDAGNEYVYLAGVASCAANDAVTYNATTFVAVRSVADAVGFIAIAKAAILAANWGWFQIYGFSSVSSGTVTVANGAFLSATAGRLSVTSVAGDFVNGFVFTGADVTNVAPAHYTYPYVTNTVPA